MDAEERAHNESLLQIYTGHLRQLEIMAAKYGDLAVPSHVTLEIEEYRRKIADLETRLRSPATGRSAGLRHNLPPRDYERFVGRQKELAEVHRLLSSRSRAFVVTIDGIGGIGKSALALESAYSFLDQHAELPVAERFEAIVWVSAKRTYLTASGIRERRQVFRTLDDLFTTIARVLDYPAITRARTEEQREIVEQVLREQRTLLILDNLETVDDESLLDFLHELPQPTKALVTTRHRIDVARAIRLTGMEHDDALGLINQESMRKDVALHQEEQEDLWGRTGGMPLAIVWSIGLMGLGGSVESVLRRLSSGQNDIARFCFEESVTKIRGRSAHRLLLALALFDADVSRPILGEVAGLGEDTYGRDQGLAELLQLSLVNKEGDRFDLLPLTRTYALEDLARSPELEQELRNRWVTHLTELARPYGGLHWRWRDRRWLRQEGKHFDTLADWSLQEARPDVLLLLLPALLYYYDLMGRWADALSLGKIGLDYAHLIQDGESILFTAQFMSWILNHQGRIHEAASYGASALAVAEQMDSPAWLCSTLQNYSQTLRRRGQFDYALDCCQRALEQLSELDDNSRVYVRADIEYELGKIARDRADWARAVAHFRVARDVFRLDDENPVFNLEFAWGLLSNVGYVAHQMGDLDEAYQTYMRCLGSYRETVGKGDMATLLTRIASVEVQRGHADAARDYAREALEWSRKLGMIQEQAAAEALLTKLAEEP